MPGEAMVLGPRPWAMRHVQGAVRLPGWMVRSSLSLWRGSLAKRRGRTTLVGRYDLDCSQYLLLSAACVGNTSELGAAVRAIHTQRAAGRTDFAARNRLK